VGKHATGRRWCVAGVWRASDSMPCAGAAVVPAAAADAAPVQAVQVRPCMHTSCCAMLCSHGWHRCCKWSASCTCLCCVCLVGLWLLLLLLLLPRHHCSCSQRASCAGFSLFVVRCCWPVLSQLLSKQCMHGGVC
jgi:hypothetical protein